MIKKLLVMAILSLSVNAFAGAPLSLERYKNLMVQISKDMPELKDYEVVVLEPGNQGWGSHGVNVVLVSPDQSKKIEVRYVFAYAHPIPFKE